MLAALDVSSQFRDAILAAGLTPPGVIEADGKLHRFASDGKRGDDAGWYVLHDNGLPAGSFGCWRNGVQSTWCAKSDKEPSASERQAMRDRTKAMQVQREAELTQRHTEARDTAAQKLAQSKPVTQHHYLSAKKIQSHGVKALGDKLVIPMRDTAGVLHSLQFIGGDGSKQFMTGGRVTGCYYGIGKPDGVLCIAEGYATGVSIHEATGYAVAVTFNAGNLLAVAKALHEKFPELRLILCADDDYRTESNPGLTKANEAARAVGGLVAIPAFGTDRPDKATDFNDMAQQCGVEAVKQAITSAEAPTATDHQPDPENAPAGDPDGWPEPQPLAAKVEPEPYPIDALPDTILAAVEEVAGFVKAPLPMVAGSALAALSLAIQAHVDVKRAEKLTGPVGLFLLTIADSGERKSTCDGFFTKSIRDYEMEQAEAAKPILKNYQASIDAWEAERGGIKDKIRQLSKEQKSTEAMKQALIDIGHDKPEAPKIPRLIYADATPEALAFGLATKWPSAGVVSAEAGIVFGSHGMGKDSVMRNLATLNQLWDGTSLTVDRRTSESFTVKGARLTVALQIQEPTLREFFSRSGALARGTGFLARFLVAWPKSTQGFRPFTEAPENWPHLATFNRRVAAILAQPAPIDDDGALTPAMLSLTPDAKAAWVSFHDAIEGELASCGELYDVRDVASKSADNAVRLAALFQVFEGAGGAIGCEAFESASRIAAWHLNEARRFFGELALPVELADAARLDKWLIEHCQANRTHFVSKNQVRQHGPLRDGARLDAAIRELADLDRMCLVKEGKRRLIRINPALMEVTP